MYGRKVTIVGFVTVGIGQQTIALAIGTSEAKTEAFANRRVHRAFDVNEVVIAVSRLGKTAKAIVEEKGLVQVSDTAAIDPIVDDIIAAHPDEVQRYQGGQKKLMGFFVGQVMKQTKGKANPKVVNEILRKKLG